MSSVEAHTMCSKLVQFADVTWGLHTSYCCDGWAAFVGPGATLPWVAALKDRDDPAPGPRKCANAGATHQLHIRPTHSKNNGGGPTRDTTSEWNRLQILARRALLFSLTPLTPYVFIGSSSLSSRWFHEVVVNRGSEFVAPLCGSLSVILRVSVTSALR